ncbi:tRNA 2'-phosphotransferase 1-like [Palaemon carinicauda]|uniref:tRNA 2'-phosphotransferase 1-like n=1 Tax=Palaemon carinicauda TaxID=392227 RepID=UPI0035B6128D
MSSPKLQAAQPNKLNKYQLYNKLYARSTLCFGSVFTFDIEKKIVQFWRIWWNIWTSHQTQSATKISKALSWLLRHGADREGLALDSGGWAKLSDVLRRPQFKKVTVEKVKEIVANCPKLRFKLEEREAELYIRANQGHSLQVEDLELEEITSDDGTPVIHGTYRKYWESIRKEGLRRMTRNHVHFTSKRPEEVAGGSGIRSSCQIYIYVDLAKALQGGLKFFRSANNVILCPGNSEGIVSREYFLKVVDRQSGERLQ